MAQGMGSLGRDGVGEDLDGRMGRLAGRDEKARGSVRFESCLDLEAAGLGDSPTLVRVGAGFLE